MFTGIVQATVELVAIERKEYLQTNILKLPENLLNDLILGSSIAINGCCVTVTKIKDNLISFDLIQETLKITSLGNLAIGDIVNLERAIKFHDEIGGHLITGHINTIAKIKKIISIKNNYKIWFKIENSSSIYYIMYKGFIAVDGISLTVSGVANNCFSVDIIPETLKKTNLYKKKVGDKVNIEIDFYTKVITDTTERLFLKFGFQKNIKY